MGWVPAGASGLIRRVWFALAVTLLFLRLPVTEEQNPDGISLVFAELKDPVRAKLERYELSGPFDPEHFFPSSEAAVEASCGHAAGER